MATTQSDFIGQGIILPLALVNGAPQLVTSFDLIRASIITILSWQYGKRFFLAEFGSQLENLLEEPNDKILEDLIKVFVVDAISKWDARIEVKEMIMKRNNDISLDLTLTYQLLNIKKEDTFTFPFYTKIIY